MGRGGIAQATARGSGAACGRVPGPGQWQQRLVAADGDDRVFVVFQAEVGEGGVQIQGISHRDPNANTFSA